MSEEKEYPSYNINVGVPTEIETLIKIKTFKYHPYGLEGFRKELIRQVDKWQSEGLSWRGHDQLTHAWRTPWDTHIRYEELMSPISATVMGVVKNHSPDVDWHLSECWISEYTHGSAANKHNHGDDTFGWSFCYYVEMPDSGPAFGVCDDVNGHINQLNATTGDLLIFRHPLHHQVFPSVEGRRIIISGNIMVDDIVPIILTRKYYNENLQNEDNILSATHHDVDVSDWSKTVYSQKLDIDLTGGY